MPGRVRGKVFSKEFMSQFSAIHNIDHQSDVAESHGYPDMVHKKNIIKYQ